MKPTLLLPAVVLCFTASCRDEKEIKVYRVARADASQPSATGALHPGVPGGAAGSADEADPHAGIPDMSGEGGDPHAGLTSQDLAMLGPAAGPRVADSAPASWMKQPASSMRKLSYRAGDDKASADISLVILRGAAGGKLTNVNRWREELGHDTLTQDALADASTRIATSMGEALVVDLESKKEPLRMIGAIVDAGKDGWFFRMRGTPAVVAAERENFLAWLQSVRTDRPTKINESAKPAAPTGDDALVWSIPKGWEPDPAASTMRYATFRITNEPDGKGEVAVTHFPGDVGGDLENVNRWRGQLGLSRIDQAALGAMIRTLPAGEKVMSFIDLTGQSSRMAVGWTRHGGETWFFKLSGPDPLVAAELERFTGYLQSIRFTRPE